MKFHLITPDGGRHEVSPLAYAQAPACQRHALMESIRIWKEMPEEVKAQYREAAKARREIRMERELEKNCEAALKLKRK